MPEPAKVNDPVTPWSVEIESLRDATELDERDRLGWALLSKAALLRELERGEEALPVLDEVIERLDGTPELEHRVASALAGKAAALDDLQRRGEALAVSEDFVSRFGETTDEQTRPHVVYALNRKSSILIKLKRYEDAIRVVDDLLARFRDATEPAVRDLLGSALYNKAISLEKLKRRDAAVAAYDEMLEMSDSDPKRVARALTYEGALLWKLDRWQESSQAYGEVVDRFAGATDPSLRAYVTYSLHRRAANLVVLGREPEARAALDVMTMRFGDDLSRRAVLGIRLFRVVIGAIVAGRRIALGTRWAMRRGRS
jgi:tetratricopeptide (TPR) repeat protein